jgi:hypothetical protein
MISQEGALQKHPGIELFFKITMYGGYDLGCHLAFPILSPEGFSPI